MCTIYFILWKLQIVQLVPQALFGLDAWGHANGTTELISTFRGKHKGLNRIILQRPFGTTFFFKQKGKHSETLQGFRAWYSFKQ